jgi:rhodanese-related sulfurtransferase
MDMHFDGVIYQTYAGELARRQRYSHPPYRIVDVRDAADFERGHIAGAIRATATKSGLPDGATPGTEFFVVGTDPDDARVRQASLALRARGALRCVELPGGMLEWRQSGLPVESADA